MRRVYLRRRIVAAVAVLVPVLVIIFLVTSGGGGSKTAGGHSHGTTTSVAPTTTVPLQPVAAVASWHLPVSLSRSVVLPINTELGVFGGLTSGASSKNIYEIDPATGITTEIGTMPAAVHDAAGAVIGSSYDIFGGGGTTENADVQQFSFSNSTHMTGAVVATLPEKRADLAADTVNGQTYLVGGFDGKKWLPTVLDTTDGMTFAPTAQLSPAVRYPAVAVVGGMLYVIGGELSPNAADSTNIQQVNLGSGAVTALSPLPVGLSHAAAVTLNGTIYVLGGRSGGHAIDTISQLSPATGQLQTVGHLPAARSDMGVAVMGETAYLLGGETDAGTQVNTVVTVRLVPPGSA